MSSQDAVRVYGAGDLAIAYLGPQDDATARALCWPAKQVFGRIYGDGARLGQALMAMGYSEAGRTGFNGARLLLEREGSGYVCPYVDYGYRVEERGEFLVLGQSGVLAESQSGVLGGMSCENCHDGVDEDEYFSPDHGGVYCESCYCELFFYCEGCDCTVDADDAVHVGDEWRCESCADETHPECEGCNARHPAAEIYDVQGTRYCEACYCDNASVCEKCDESYCHEDMQDEQGEDGDEVWCDYCVEQHEKEQAQAEKRAAQVLTFPPRNEWAVIAADRARHAAMLKFYRVPNIFTCG
jgi:hypothetical protein